MFKSIKIQIKKNLKKSFFLININKKILVKYLKKRFLKKIKVILSYFVKFNKNIIILFKKYLEKYVMANFN